MGIFPEHGMSETDPLKPCQVSSQRNELSIENVGRQEQS